MSSLKQSLTNMKSHLMQGIGICLTWLIKCKKLLATAKSIKRRKLTSLELSNLKECDILLVRNSGWISDTISEALNSQWTHVALYIGNEQVIDTDLLEEVGIRSIYEFDSYRIVRVKGLRKSQKEKVLKFMYENIGKEYDYAQILGFVLEYRLGIKNKIHEPNKYTCAKLIDLAFKEAGIDLLDGYDGDITPKEITNSLKIVSIS